MAPGLKSPSEEAINHLIRHVTGHEALPVTHDSLPKLMIMLHDFTQQAQFAEELMKQFDLDDSGKIEIEELLLLLKKVLRDARGAVDARMGAGDVLYILTRCDVDGDMRLSRDELVPALALWREIAPHLPVAHEDQDDELDAAAISRALVTEQNKALEEGAPDVVVKVGIMDSVEADVARQYGLTRNARHASHIERGGESARVHWLEDATIVKEGVSRSIVIARDGVKVLVDNSELKEALRVKGKRLAAQRAVEQTKLNQAAILLDQDLAKGHFGGDAQDSERSQTFLMVGQQLNNDQQGTSVSCLLL